MDEPWPWTPRASLQARQRKNQAPLPLFSYACPFPFGVEVERSFLQEAEREKPGNKSVDGRV